MVKKSTPNISAFELETVEFMTEFARYLLPAGISSARFIKIAQLAYLRAATFEAKFGNDKINQSAVAAMTGLNRTQVRELLKRGASALSKKDGYLDKMIRGWTADAEFITANFLPRKLRVSGRRATFQSLAKRYGGDVPAKSLLRELERRGQVRTEGGLVTLQKPSKPSNSMSKLRNISSALGKTIKTGARAKSQGPIRIVALEAVHPAASSAGRILMQRRIAQSAKSFVTNVEAAGKAIALESPALKSQSSWKTQTRVLLVTQDCEE